MAPLPNDGRRLFVEAIGTFFDEPARSLGLAVVAGGWRGHWLYWLAPIAGMLVAARAFEFVRPASRPQAAAPARTRP